MRQGTSVGPSLLQYPPTTPYLFIALTQSLRLPPYSTLLLRASLLIALARFSVNTACLSYYFRPSK